MEFGGRTFLESGCHVKERACGGTQHGDAILVGEPFGLENVVDRIGLPRVWVIRAEQARGGDWSERVVIRTDHPDVPAFERNGMMSRRSYWFVAIALMLTMINAVPAFAATGVIWGT